MKTFRSNKAGKQLWIMKVLLGFTYEMNSTCTGTGAVHTVSLLIAFFFIRKAMVYEFMYQLLGVMG